MEVRLSLLLSTLFLAWISLRAFRLLYNVFFHPLRAYPGPLAAKATTWWKTYIEVVKQESMVDVLFRLHKQFGPYSHSRAHISSCSANADIILGDVVRVGPNEVGPRIVVFSQLID
jgi:hypothetical protein